MKTKNRGEEPFRSGIKTELHGGSNRVSLVHRVVLVLLAVFFYYNTLPNEFALDDVMVLTENRFVQQGPAGIPDIITHDSFYGATGRPAKQLGWRYRPLSLVSYAIEYPLFKRQWAGYHFMNLVYYALLCVVIYGFLLKWIFPGQTGLAFIITVLFTVSPVHPEVVANIKSRDEIFALLFLVLYFGSLLRYAERPTAKGLFSALFLLLLALASKESNALAIVYTPALLFVIRGSGVGDSLRRSIPYAALVVLYIGLRVWISPVPEQQTDLMNDPYALAANGQKPATILFILLKYLQLMTFPEQLTFDYGYNHTPYRNLTDPLVVLSAVVHGVLLVWSVLGVIRRKASAMWVLFYLMGMFLLSNALLLVGPPMAERFLFTPGLFFLMAIVPFMHALIKRLPNKVIRPVVVAGLAVYVVFCFTVVHARNPEWRNNRTLYFADLQKAPNSVRIQAFCGMTLVSEVDAITDSVKRVNAIRTAIAHFERARAIYPDYAPMYQDWGGCYYRLGIIDSTEWAWNLHKALKPDSRFIPFNEESLAKMKYNACVVEYQRAKDRMNIPELLEIQRRAVSYYPVYAPGWLFLGKLYGVNGQADSAAICWGKCLELDSSQTEAKDLLERLTKGNTGS